jgi:hypothetical protein
MAPELHKIVRDVFSEGSSSKFLKFTPSQDLPAQAPVPPDEPQEIMPIAEFVSGEKVKHDGLSTVLFCPVTGAELTIASGL